jgi:hypothetical protein
VPIWAALQSAGLRATGRQRFGGAVPVAWREKHRAKDRSGPRGDCSREPGTLETLRNSEVSTSRGKLEKT